MQVTERPRERFLHRARGAAGHLQFAGASRDADLDAIETNHATAIHGRRDAVPREHQHDVCALARSEREHFVLAVEFRAVGHPGKSHFFVLVHQHHPEAHGRGADEFGVHLQIDHFHVVLLAARKLVPVIGGDDKALESAIRQTPHRARQIANDGVH